MHNEILVGVSKKECEALLSNLEFVEMRLHDVLNEMGESIKYCYFVNSGLASILNVMSDGKSVEVELTGKEAFVGLPVVVGLNTSAKNKRTPIVSIHANGETDGELVDAYVHGLDGPEALLSCISKLLD